MNVQEHQADAENLSREEFAALWSQCQGRLEVYLRSIFPSRQDQEDVLQESARKAIRYIDSYDRNAHFFPWVLQIARNCAIDYRRAKKKEAVLLDSHALDCLAASAVRLSDEVPDRSDALEHCLKKVDDKRRSILKLRYEDGRTVNSIAESLGVRPNAVTHMLKRVRVALGDCIAARLSSRGGHDVT